jgi:hypothetical protein
MSFISLPCTALAQLASFWYLGFPIYRFTTCTSSSYRIRDLAGHILAGSSRRVFQLHGTATDFADPASYARRRAPLARSYRSAYRMLANLPVLCGNCVSPSHAGDMVSITRMRSEGVSGIRPSSRRLPTVAIAPSIALVGVRARLTWFRRLAPHDCTSFASESTAQSLGGISCQWLG